MLCCLRIEVAHEVQQGLLVDDFAQFQHRILIKPATGCEKHFAAICHDLSQQIIFSSGDIEVIYDQQRVFFQRPQETGMALIAHFIGVVRQVIHEVHAGDVFT